MSSSKNGMWEEMRDVLCGPRGYAVVARHPARNEQILVVTIVPGQTNEPPVSLTFTPHHSGGDHIDIRVYRIHSEACPDTPPLQPGDILPLSAGTHIGSIRHDLDVKRREEPTVRVTMNPDGTDGLSVYVIETPERQEIYFLHLDNKEGHRNG